MKKAKTFYNESRKRDYIDSAIYGKSDDHKKTIGRSCEKLFELIAPFEFEFDRDLAEFDDAQYTKMRSSIFDNLLTRKTKFYMSHIEKYIQWCFDNEYINNNQLLMSSPVRFSPQVDLVDKMYRNGYLGSRQDFIEYCELFFGSSSMLMPRAVACLAWMGLSNNEINELRKEDFDVNRGTILRQKIEDPFILETLLAVKTAKGYYSIEPDGATGSYKQYTPSDYLILTYKGPAEENRSYERVIAYVNRLTKLEDKVARNSINNIRFTTHRLKDVRITTHKFNVSGCFLRTHKYEEQHGILLTRSQFENMPDLYYYGKYEDYKLWREAFYR